MSSRSQFSPQWSQSVAGIVWKAVVTAAAGLLICTSAQAEVQREARTVGAFTAVKVEGAIDVSINQGDADTVSVDADRNEIHNIRTDVVDGTLVISNKTGWSLLSWFRSPAVTPRATVTAKGLMRIAVEGSGDIHANTLVSQTKFEVTVAGSGDVRIDTLGTKTLEVRIAGSGDVRIAGAAIDQSIRIAGSGDYRAPDFKSSTTKISISGSGDATVWARDKLDVSIAGSGDVAYFGAPTVSQSIAGSGSVKALGQK